MSLKTDNSSLVSSYNAAISDLRSASRGGYAGPAISSSDLAKALGAIDGLNTAELQQHTRNAVGESDPTTMRSGIALMLKKTLHGVLNGILGNFITDRVNSWSWWKDRSQEMQECVDEGTRVIDEVCDSSQHSVRTLMVFLAQAIRSLCNTLNSLELPEHIDLFRELVSCGSKLIDDTGKLALEQCKDRDEAINQCFDHMIGEARKITEDPDCEEPPEVKECVVEDPCAPEPDPCPPTVPPTTGNAPAPSPGGTAPAPAPGPAPGPAPAPSPAPSPAPAPPSADSTPEPTPEPKPEPEPKLPPSAPIGGVTPPSIPKPELPDLEDLCPPELDKETPDKPEEPTKTEEPDKAPETDCEEEKKPPAPTPEPAEVEQEDCEPKPDPEPEPEPAKEPEEDCEEPEPEPEPDPKPEPEPEPAPELECEEDEEEDCPPAPAGSSIFGGIVGVIGIGILAFGIGKIIEDISDHLQPPPLPEPEPAPAPPPPAPPAPAPPPPPNLDELAKVPEPPPPPKKFIHAAPPPPPPPVDPAAGAPTKGIPPKAGAW